MNVMGVDQLMDTKSARVPFRQPWVGRWYINVAPVNTGVDAKSASIPFRGMML